MIPYIETNDTITVLVNTKTIVAHKKDHDIDKIRQACIDDDVGTLEFILDKKQVVINFGEGSIEVDNGGISYKGEEIHNIVVDRILECIHEGKPFTPLAKFLDRLMSNPSKQTVDNLYKFLEWGGFPIMDDGRFIGYKSVRSDFNDWHSNTTNNSPGTTVSMRRNAVCDNNDRGCAAGLHVGTMEYASNFHRGSSYTMVLCAVAPEDVVSVPNDYSYQKIRACKYEVLAVHTGQKLKNTYAHSG